MESPSTSPSASSSSSSTESPSMPPPYFNTDSTTEDGTSDFPLPIGSSSPVTGVGDGESPWLTDLNTDQAFGFLPPSFPTSYNPRKRRRESLKEPSLSAESVAKSRITTPSPAITGNTTPASFGSFDYSQDPHLLQLLGGNPKDHMAEMMEEQKARERDLAAKTEQERIDAEFARQLAEMFDHEQPVLSSGTEDTLQSFPNYSSTIHRPEPLLPPGVAPKSSQSPFTFSTARNPNLSSPFTAPTRSSTQVHPAPPQTFENFVDLGSDEEENGFQAPAKTSVNSNRNNLMDTNNPWWSVNAQDNAGFNAFDTNTAFGATTNSDGSNLNSLGGSNVYHQPWDNGLDVGKYSMSWADRMGNFSESLANMAKGMKAFTSASDLLHQPTPSYPSSSYSYGQPASQISSGTPIIDLDLYDEPHSRMNNYPYGNPATRTIPWNDELRDRYMERVNYLTNDPTRTTEEIRDLLENIRPDEELPIEDREGTPDAMVYPLMEHQKLGLAWMKAMEEGTNKGGILADDMGLGKTIQALALMVARKSQDPRRKTTLIVAPLALMKQWEREIKTKLKGGREHQLTIYTLHGQGRGAMWEELRSYDVVLTTFGTLSTEIKRKELIDQSKRQNPNWRAVTKADRLPLLGDECKWYRVILDEAQCIKNRSTKAAQGAYALQSLTRFCMSGTPMQNGVIELYSLIHFLRIRPYNDFHRFSMDFIRSLKGTYEPGKARAMQKLQALLKAILLRRNKKSTIDGKPILSLPDRTTESRHAAFSEDEQAFYTALESQTQLQFNKYLRAGTVGRNYSNVLVLLLRLRQACCHPHLIRDFGVSSGSSEVSTEDLTTMAKELAPDVVARIIRQSDVNEQSGLECPVCMDATENATIFIPCGHNTCSECFARISDPSQAIADGEDGGTNLKCPQCRGKISPSRITDHTTFKKVHIGDPSAAADLLEELQGPSDSESETDDDTTDDEDSDLDGFIVKDDEETTDEEGYRKGRTPFERSLTKKPKSKKKKSKKGKGKAKEKSTRKSLAQLKKESLRNMKARKKYVARLRETWESSAKIDRTMEILQGIQDSKEGEKTIIFSQFTSLLDLLEIPIYDRGWDYARYDGSMSATARNDAVLKFQDEANCKILLVSLRAGNSGLNLVAASQVIIMDPFWNPYVEEQAIDRAHRIGQQRPVQVHRILIPGTVEDRILTLQEKKRAMIESALDENASKEVGRLGVRELGYLFVSAVRSNIGGKQTHRIRVSLLDIPKGDNPFSTTPSLQIICINYSRYTNKITFSSRTNSLNHSPHRFGSSNITTFNIHDRNIRYPIFYIFIVHYW
ncbi:MAG: hypothetical protein Q9170_002842 [Blastenia crenularia]